MVSLAILVGCESEPTKQIRPVTTSGFLGDYSMLREGGEGEAALVEVSPKADFAAHDKIILDPVTIGDLSRATGFRPTPTPDARAIGATSQRQASENP